MSQSEAGLVYRFGQWTLCTIFKGAKIRKQILVMTISGNYFQKKKCFGKFSMFFTEHMIISYKAHFYCLFQQCVIWAQLQAGLSNKITSSGSTVGFTRPAKRSISKGFKTIKSNVFWSQFDFRFIISNA